MYLVSLSFEEGFRTYSQRQLPFAIVAEHVKHLARLLGLFS